jgi:solute carrier family 25 oxoglutarate transporter 11
MTAVDSSPSMKDNAVWKAAQPFVTGSLSGMFATCCIQPIDMVKVRIQLQAGTAEAAGPLTVAANMLKNEGLGGMYKGIDSALTRQVVYTGARLGLFDKFKDMTKDTEAPAILKSAGCALAAGGIAAVIGNPADLALIRMQADGMLPAAERRGYNNVFAAFSSIVKNEGVGGLFAGAGPTATRAMALNLGMLGGNQVATEKLKGMGLSGGALVFTSSAIAGFLASAFSLPFDFVKTQMQKQKPDPVTGELPFSSSIACAMKTLKEGGPLRFYAGFPTFYVRIAPHAMITLIAQDQLKGFWKKQGLL